MKYTVIIPHRNSQEFLIRCLKSIPDNNKFQIVVIDDCSCHDKVSFDFVRAQSDRDFELIILESNQGAGVARTEGLRHAQGDYILFADVDDYFLADVENLLDQAVDGGSDEIIFFNIDDKENFSVQGQRYQNFIDSYDGTEERLSDLKYRSWSPWAKLFKRQFIENHQLYFESRKKGNDCFFVLNAMVKAKNIKVVKSPLYHLSYSPNSLSHSYNAKWEYMYDVYDLWLWRYRFFKNNGIPLWKEYNLVYLIKEVTKTFGLKESLKILLRSVHYRYSITDLIASKIYK